MITAPYITSNDPLGTTVARPVDALSAFENGAPAGTGITYVWYSSANNYSTSIGTGATYTVQAGDAFHSISNT